MLLKYKCIWDVSKCYGQTRWNLSMYVIRISQVCRELMWHDTIRLDHYNYVHAFPIHLKIYAIQNCHLIYLDCLVQLDLFANYCAMKLENNTITRFPLNKNFGFFLKKTVSTAFWMTILNNMSSKDLIYQGTVQWKGVGVLNPHFRCVKILSPPYTMWKKS